MKKIEAIIRPSKVGDVCDILEKIGHPGIMLSELEGHGKQKGIKQEVRGKTYKVDLLTKARLEVIVKDSDLAKTVKAIFASMGAYRATAFQYIQYCTRCWHGVRWNGQRASPGELLLNLGHNRMIIAQLLQNGNKI